MGKNLSKFLLISCIIYLLVIIDLVIYNIRNFQVMHYLFIQYF